MRRHIAKWRVWLFAPTLIAVAIGFAACAADANATTPITVNNTAELESAINTGNSSVSSPTTIVVAPGVYNPSYEVEFTNTAEPITIEGPTPAPNVKGSPAQIVGSAVISPEPDSPLFLVDPGVTVSFDDLYITTAGGEGNEGIDDQGTLNLSQTSVDDEAGPGVYVEPSMLPGAVLNASNSTFAQNLGEGIIDGGTTNLTNVTVAENRDGVDNGSDSGVLNLVNTIIANNTAAIRTGGNYVNCTAQATDSDHSLDTDGTCGVGALSDVTQKLPVAGPANNGGTTLTLVPPAASPAITAGDGSKCTGSDDVDQRGAPRPSVGCDIGSVQTDLAAPTATPADITTNSGAAVTFAPAWTDATSPVTTSCNPASGSEFSVGITPVTCTGTDAFGNVGKDDFTVTVTQPLVITIAAPTTPIAATSSAGAPVTYTVSTTDTTDGSNSPKDTPSCTPASGSTFPLGTTTITCNATDTTSFAATATAIVTVADETPPVITQPGHVGPIVATSPVGAAVPYAAPTVTDLVDGSDGDPVICAPASGSTFAVGTTSVTCNATDKSGLKAAPVTFTVTVTDGSPGIAQPSNITQNATSPAGADVAYTPPTATDIVDGTDTVTCLPASGTTFAIGATKVTCNAKNTSGTAATPVTFTVTVTDDPTITVPGPQTAAATGPSGATVNYPAVTMSDPVDGAGADLVKCNYASPASFPVGTTTVTCTTTNKANQSASATFTVTVTDLTLPVIAGVPVNIGGIPAASAAGAVVTYALPTSTDLVDGTDPVTCSPASGSTFAIGTTPVTCNAKDAHGNNAAPQTFTVTVSDATSPALSVPSGITVAATSAAGASVAYNVSATDLPGVTDSIGCTPISGATFAVGTTTVNCAASDSEGNHATASFTVTVTAFANGNTGVLGTHTTSTVGTATIASAKTKGNIATVIVSCAGSSTSHCAVTLELIASGGKTVFTKKSVTVAGGKRETISLRLDTAGVSQVKKHHNVTLRLLETGGATHNKTIVFKG